MPSPVAALAATAMSPYWQVILVLPDKWAEFLSISLNTLSYPGTGLFLSKGKYLYLEKGASCKGTFYVRKELRLVMAEALI